MPECFVSMPLTTPSDVVERYGGDPDHFGHVLEHLFVPAIEAAGFDAKRPIAEGSDLIHAEIVRNLETADMVLCDISTLNANVFFEFGIRTALHRPICLVGDEHTQPPFDIGGINCHEYASGMKAWQLAADVEHLTKHLEPAAKRRDNALWRHFGSTPRDTDAINSAAPALRLTLDEIQKRQREPEDTIDKIAISANTIEEFVDRAGRILELRGVAISRIDHGTTWVRFVSVTPVPSQHRQDLIEAGLKRGFDVRVSSGEG